MKIISLIVLSLMICGCSSLGPERPIQYSGPIAAFNYIDPSAPNYFRRAYNPGAAPEVARAERNAILADLKAIIDNNFYLFESNFGFGKRTKDFAVQTAAQGMSAAGALLTGGVTQILSGASGALIATNTKFDETTFVDQTVSTIQLEMRTLRTTQEAAMLKKWGSSVADYPLELGISDLLEYYQAGTFGRAMSSIAARTGEKQQEAQNMQNGTSVTKETIMTSGIPNMIPNATPAVSTQKTTTTNTVTH